jgi:hypothetical protein
MKFVRKIFALCVFLFTGSALMAQDTIPLADTTRNPKIFISGFGGIISETSVLNGSISECVGAGGALTLNHYFYLGGYGLTMTSNHYITDLIIPLEHAFYDSTSQYFYYGKKVRTNLNHAGFWVGGIFFPKKRVHLGISTKIGWGRIHLIEGVQNTYITNTTLVTYRLDYAANKVFVITPEIEVEVGITSWLKCHLGIGYRYISGVTFDRYKDFKFNSYQISFGLYFGGFYNKEPVIEIQPEPQEE